MAYSTITAAQIAVGEATKKELFQKIKDNEDDLNTRVTANEAAAGSVIPIRFELLGKYNHLVAPKTGLMYYRVNFDATLSGAVIMIYEDGTGGTVEVDVQKKRGAGAFATVFSTKPSVANGSGDFTVSTNAVFSDTDIDAGDILRFDLTGTMTGPDIDGFELILNYTT